MTGYTVIRRIKAVEERLNLLGLRWGYGKSGTYEQAFNDDSLTVFPNSECLPVFARDAELFRGSLEDLVTWLNGIEWARRYDTLLGLTNDKKRAAKEERFSQDLKNKALMEVLAKKEKQIEPVSS